MAIDDALLKLENTSDVRKMSPAEEDYIAHRAGLQLGAAALTDPGSINITASGTVVGTYDDTSFDEAVGAHPGPFNTTTISTTLHQTTGTAEESSMVKPVLHLLADETIRAANDTQFNVVVDRIIAKIFADEHPGSYRLASSTPGSDWTAIHTNVFTDTRTDGGSVNYTIWKKTSATEPTKISCLKLGDGPEGVRAMTPAEIQYSFGQRAKTRIMSSASYIGSYQLRTSAQGAPTDPGTWVAKGTALDTKQEVADNDYTRISVGQYQRNSQNDYAGDYTGDFIGNYLLDFIGDYTGDYVGDYLGVDYLGEYIADYDRVRATGYTGDYTGNYTGDFTGDFTGDYTGDFTGNYIATFGGSEGAAYTRNSTNVFQRNSQRNSTNVFQRNSTQSFTGDFTGNYEGATFVGDYAVNYLGEYLQDFTRNSTIDYLGEYLQNFIGNYLDDFTGDYLTDYTGNFLGSTIQGTNETIETYTLYVRTA